MQLDWGSEGKEEYGRTAELRPAECKVEVDRRAYFFHVRRWAVFSVQYIHVSAWLKITLSVLSFFYMVGKNGSY